jgi:hypothetical protein
MIKDVKLKSYALEECEYMEPQKINHLSMGHTPSFWQGGGENIACIHQVELYISCFHILFGPPDLGFGKKEYFM